MNKTLRLLLIFLLGVLLLVIARKVGIPGYLKVHRKGDDQTFVAQFKTSLIQRCQGEHPAEHRAAFCQCAGEEMIKRLTIPQLEDFEFAKTYAEKTVFPFCMDQSNKNANLVLPVKPFELKETSTSAPNESKKST